MPILFATGWLFKIVSGPDFRKFAWRNVYNIFLISLQCSKFWLTTETEMAKPSKYSEMLSTVTRDVINHPRDLTRHYAEQFGISRVSANKYIQKLETEGWIARSGPSTHPVFSPGYKRRISKVYSLNGLEEDEAWGKDFKPFFNLTINVQSIVNHGFTEMINNAVDHSGGEAVFALMDQNEKKLYIIIADDGIGIFAKITNALGLSDMRQALFELSKGKLTTDPSRHTGEGVFFTSRMFDTYMISANGLHFNHSDDFKNDLFREGEEFFLGGTTVFMEIDLFSQRTTSEVYSQFTGVPDDYGFSKTIVPMKLARYGDEQLVSRSQAKRLIARFDRFKIVILDFDGIQEIGQAFADELFRVYATAHSEVELIPENMTEQVQRMWLRAISSNIF